MANAIALKVNGVSVGKTNLVNSYQATGQTFGLANA